MPTAIVGTFAALLLASATELVPFSRDAGEWWWSLAAVAIAPALRVVRSRAPGVLRRFVPLGGFVAAFALVLFRGGWARTVSVDLALSENLLALYGLLLVPAGGLGFWSAMWLSERRVLFMTTVTTTRRPSGVETLRSARPIVLPLALFAATLAAIDLAQVERSVAQVFVLYPSLTVVAGVVGMAAAMVVLPLLVRAAWVTEPLPPGPFLDSLSALARAARVRLHSVRVAVDAPHLINACVLGYIPALRYVIFTRGACTLLAPADLRAVFAHEIGHVRRGHLWWYAAMLVGFVFALGALRPWADALPEWARIAALLGMLLLWWVGLFGFVSRRFEVEADLAAADLIGPDAYLTTLRRVAALVEPDNPRGGWRHFSLARRGEMLARIAGSGAERRGFRRVSRGVRLGCALVVAVSTVALAARAIEESRQSERALAIASAELEIGRAEHLTELLATRNVPVLLRSIARADDSLEAQALAALRHAAEARRRVVGAAATEERTVELDERIGNAQRRISRWRDERAGTGAGNATPTQ